MALVTFDPHKSRGIIIHNLNQNTNFAISGLKPATCRYSTLLWPLLSANMAAGVLKKGTCFIRQNLLISSPFFYSAQNTPQRLARLILLPEINRGYSPSITMVSVKSISWLFWRNKGEEWKVVVWRPLNRKRAWHHDGPCPARYASVRRGKRCGHKRSLPISRASAPLLLT